jgi:murein DD-endopeptidase MepM/ murein hydrolase activator NlpD
MFKKIFVFILIFSLGYFINNIDYLSKNSINNKKNNKEEILNLNLIQSVGAIKEKKVVQEIKSIKYEKKTISVDVKNGDSLYKILSEKGISPSKIFEITNKIKKRDKSKININIGNKIYFNYIENSLISFDIYYDKISFFKVVLNSDEGIIVYKDEKPTYREKMIIKGVINDSLYLDGIKAGLDDRLVVMLSEIFAWDIDFSRDLNEGDEFIVIYEKIMSGNDFIENGRILMAFFKVKRGDFYAVNFSKDESNSKYFDLNGINIEKAFIRSPVKFPRITSKFTYKRYHPILKTYRPHRGVDYGGSRNTPIMATGSGKIEYINKKRAYGNHIIIDHGLGYKTLYAHLNKFKKGLKKGDYVDQSQVIGYMGTTGLSTGVHLHYEFRINGNHVDALSIELPDGKPVKNKEEFELIKNNYLKLMGKI